MKRTFKYNRVSYYDCKGVLISESGKQVALTLSFVDFVKAVFTGTPWGFEVYDAPAEGCYEIRKEAQGYSMSYYAFEGKRFSFCKDGIYEELGRVPEVLYVKPLYV